MVLAATFLFVLSLLAVILLPAAASAGDYVAMVQLAVEKSLYGAGEELRLSGSVLLSNLSANNSNFLAVSGASVNISISNSSSNGSVMLTKYKLNASTDGTFKSRNDNFPTGIQINVPVGNGYYNISAAYRDPNNVEWKATVAVANISINGSLRYTNHTVISTFSCITNNGGVCIVSITAPATAGTYLLEANNFLSTSSFVDVPYEAFVYVRDSTGETFKEI